MKDSSTSAIHGLEDQAISRAAGADLIGGNRIRLLRDASENYPAWINAIQSAKNWIHFESFIIHNDRVGRQFSELLREKAREGVKVRLIYDWLGAIGNAGPRFWHHLADGGVDLRCFNPLKLDSPLGWISRDHRKLITVDGRVAYISGLCVGQRWLGYPEKGIDGWRDTGVEIEGPALVEIEQAFAEAWAATGEPLDPSETQAQPNRQVGDTGLRIVATVPSVGNIYRVDLLMATLARRSIWLADAYFVGTAAYVQALCAASQAGVDVRLLVPGANDVPVVRSVSRAGLRPLLEAGVRVFEWNGPMMHAKTAVIDGHRARVGSTNLNLTSWLGNWELDVIVEDEQFAGQMEEAHLDDVSRSTEIVLTTRRRPKITTAGKPVRGKRTRRASGTRRAAAGVMRIGRAVEAAITNRRPLGPAEAVIMFWGAALLVVISIVSLLWPGILVYPVAVFSGWLAISLFVRALKLRFSRSGKQGT